MLFFAQVKKVLPWNWWSTPFICSLYVLSLLLSAYAISQVWPKQAVAAKHHATILWDTWGVPHITAESDEDLFYAFGYAQMHNHADLLLTLYGEARGRAAEYGGASYLASDEFVRTMGYPEHAQAWYNAQTPEFRRYITAFVAGMNDYAQLHPEEIAAELQVVLPIQVTDVFANAERVLGDFLMSDCSSALAGLERGNGSNGWAIAPTHSANGEAMLLANPHLPWRGEYTLFEAQLTSPSTNTYGATLVGFPVLAIAFNNYLSWTHTVNTIDTCDRYALTLSGSGYLFDGKVQPFTEQTQRLLVKQADGTLKSQQLVIRRAIQGPVFVVGGNTLAIRIVGVDQFPVYGIWQEWWDMGRATNLQEFQKAVQRLQIPMFTIIYADRAGNIMSLFNGEEPKRPFGNWDYWQSVIPGDTSKTLWTSILPYSGLPKVINPPAGWVQNSNSAPWVTTFPQVLNPQDYPAYIAPQNMSLREQEGVNMLVAQSRLSFDQVIADKFSAYVESADRVLDPLISAANASGDSLAKQAAQVLQSWDRTDNAGSKGAILFYIWSQVMGQSNGPIFAIPWDPAHPLTTPSGLADPQAAVLALDQAANLMLKRLGLGSLDVTWGTVFHLQLGKTDLPASGGPGDPFGIFRALYFAQNNGQFDAVSGDTYIAVVQFSNPVHARVLLTYGNASQPDSPHVGDQLTLYAQNQMREAWLTQAQVEAHLAERDAL